MHASARTDVNHRHDLINDHVTMARKMARRMAHRLPLSVSREDVESAALLGLTEAACRYDSAREETFRTFASKRVRGAVLDHLRRIDPLSRRGRHGVRRVAATTQRLEATLGRGVTESEIAAELGVSEDEVRATSAQGRAALSVEFDELDTASLGLERETLAEVVERHQMRTALIKALQTLDPRSLMITSLYYQEGLNQREIGELLGVTESRVCQLRTQIIATLRERLS